MARTAASCPTRRAAGGCAARRRHSRQRWARISAEASSYALCSSAKQRTGTRPITRRHRPSARVPCRRPSASRRRSRKRRRARRVTRRRTERRQRCQPSTLHAADHSFFDASRRAAARANRASGRPPAPHGANERAAPPVRGGGGGALGAAARQNPPRVNRHRHTAHRAAPLRGARKPSVRRGGGGVAGGAEPAEMAAAHRRRRRVLVSNRCSSASTRHARSRATRAPERALAPARRSEPRERGVARRHRPPPRPAPQRRPRPRRRHRGLQRHQLARLAPPRHRIAERDAADAPECRAGRPEPLAVDRAQPPAA